MKTCLAVAGCIATFLFWKLAKGVDGYFRGFKAGYRKGCKDELERIKLDMAKVLARQGK